MVAVTIGVAVGCDLEPLDDENGEEEAIAWVPALEVCDPVADWDVDEYEAALRTEINRLRGQGGRCGPLTFLPAGPLRPDPALRCAARLHSLDMVTRAFLGQVDPDGRGTGDRLVSVDYPASTFGEAVGFVTAERDAPELAHTAAAAVVRTWQDNPVTCWKLFARELEDLGVGAAYGSFSPTSADDASGGVFWTATFAAR